MSEDWDAFLRSGAPVRLCEIFDSSDTPCSSVSSPQKKRDFLGNLVLLTGGVTNASRRKLVLRSELGGQGVKFFYGTRMTLQSHGVEV